MDKDILVIKFGTSSITHSDGTPDENKIAQIASELSSLQSNYRVVIVSSGAVGAGKRHIKDYKGTIRQKKAAAAVGNLALISLYGKAFEKYDVRVAQSLCERLHFGDRKKFLELKETFEELWRNDIIPIANENDVVSSRELKFSDNDELATLIAAGFGAKFLMICTLSGGLLNTQGEVIQEIKTIDQSTFSLVDDTLSSTGLGGMASKLTFTKMANAAGIDVIVFGFSQNNGVYTALNNKSGTRFLANKNKLSSRNKWLLSSSLTTGSIIIDGGATKAIQERKSLLSVGVVETLGNFQKGEFIEIKDLKNNTLAVARAKNDAKHISTDKSVLVAHADDIVML